MPKSFRTARKKAENGGSKPAVTKLAKITVSLTSGPGGYVANLMTVSPRRPAGTVVFFSIAKPVSLRRDRGRTPSSTLSTHSDGWAPLRVFLAMAEAKNEE